MSGTIYSATAGIRKSFGARAPITRTVSSNALIYRGVTGAFIAGNSGTKYPGTAANDATVGTQAWVNVSNALTDDGSVSRSDMFSGAQQFTQYLKLTNFGFSIPAGASILGVSASIDRASSVANNLVSDQVVSLVKGGTVSGDNKAVGTNWTTTFSVATYGGAADMWGLTLTADDVNASTFGIVLQAVKSSLFDSANVDTISLTVYYQTPEARSFRTVKI